MPEAERGRVFRRSRRPDAARASPGTGLGLDLAEAAADPHGMAVAPSGDAPDLRAAVSVPPPQGP